MSTYVNLWQKEAAVRKYEQRRSLESERDIKSQVFSIQEGKWGFRSDKVFCKQPPQILPAGGSPSTHCIVYQSVPIVLRIQWSGSPSHLPSYKKAGPLYSPDTESQNGGDYLLPLPPTHPPPHSPPTAPHPLCSPSCVSKVSLSLKTSSFTSSPPVSPHPLPPFKHLFCSWEITFY